MMQKHANFGGGVLQSHSAQLQKANQSATVRERQKLKEGKQSCIHKEIEEICMSLSWFTLLCSS